MSVVYAWLYVNGASVWPLIAAHTVQNVVGGEYIGLMFDGRDDVVWIGFVALVYIAWALLLIVRHGTHLGAQSPAVRIGDRVTQVN